VLLCGVVECVRLNDRFVVETKRLLWPHKAFLSNTSICCDSQGYHAVLKVLKRYWISKLAFKTLKKYWIWP